MYRYLFLPLSLSPAICHLRNHHRQPLLCIMYSQPIQPNRSSSDQGQGSSKDRLLYRKGCRKASFLSRDIGAEGHSRLGLETSFREYYRGSTGSVSQWETKIALQSKLKQISSMSTLLTFFSGYLSRDKPEQRWVKTKRGGVLPHSPPPAFACAPTLSLVLGRPDGPVAVAEDKHVAARAAAAIVPGAGL